MPALTNRTGKHWEFGSLCVPPGVSYPEPDALAVALKKTPLKSMVVYSDVIGSDRADFMLDMAACSVCPVACPKCPVPCPRCPVPEPVEKAPEPVAAASEPPDEPEHPGRDLAAHSRAELRAMAADLGVDGADKMLKGELLDVLKSL